MKRLDHGASYLVIDHRDSPGVTPGDGTALPVAGGTLLERDLVTCSHCQRQVLLNPGRVRPRAVCLKCYKYICDACEAIRVQTGACVPFAQVLDRAEALLHQYAGQPDHPALQVLRDPWALMQPGPPTILT